MARTTPPVLAEPDRWIVVRTSRVERLTGSHDVDDHDRAVKMARRATAPNTRPKRFSEYDTVSAVVLRVSVDNAGAVTFTPEAVYANGVRQ